jgi:hypothetical protein
MGIGGESLLEALGEGDGGEGQKSKWDAGSRDWNGHATLSLPRVYCVGMNMSMEISRL